jgi:hypothetical protein
MLSTLKQLAASSVVEDFAPGSEMTIDFGVWKVACFVCLLVVVSSSIVFVISFSAI